MKIFLVLITFLACLASCRIGPRYTPPVPSVPNNWKHGGNEADAAQLPLVDNWWEIFNDEELNQLIALALENNHDLYIAFERVLQARALAGISESHLYPQMHSEPYSLSRDILWMLYDPVRVIREHRRRNEVSFITNYELDLWGKLRQAYESDVLNLKAQENAFRTTLLILTTDLAENYFQIRDLDAEIILLEATSETLKKAFELLQARYKSKIMSYADVARAELEYANAKAEYFNVRKLRDLEENRLAVLIGGEPSTFEICVRGIEGIPPSIPVGLPSEVLLQRPDIAEAENLRAANHAMIGVAYASFFPSISLTGALGYSSPELKDFLSWKSRLGLLGSNFYQVIFDGGLLTSNLQLAKSKFREADEAYQQVVLEAFQEVEDSLTKIESLDQEYASIEEAVKAAKTTQRIANVRYLKGVTFYLDVVDSERQKLNAERHLIQLLGQRYAATIQLIRALGGVWPVFEIENDVETEMFIPDEIQRQDAKAPRCEE